MFSDQRERFETNRAAARTGWRPCRPVSPTALVTGATGVIGSLLVRRLLSCGWRVRTLVRNGVPAAAEQDVVRICGDITDRHALNQAVAETDVIFHLAAKLHINNPSPQLEAEYRRVNVDGTARLAEAARDAGVKRLVFFSSINVYGSSESRAYLDENSPLLSNTYYSATKREAEKIALDLTPTVILRLAAVYGPTMKGNYLRLLQVLQKGRFAFIGDGLNRRTLVHIDDVCTASLLAAEHPRAVGQVYNVTDGGVHTLREIVEAMCLALHRRTPRLCLPLGLSRCAATLFENAARVLLRRNIPIRSAIDKMVEDIAVRGDRIMSELGFQPHYDLLDGWRETIRQLGSGICVGGDASVDSSVGSCVDSGVRNLPPASMPCGLSSSPTTAVAHPS
jgi:UDP-glucose 4-epimerase